MSESDKDPETHVGQNHADYNKEDQITADHNQVDWSQVSETLTMLCLAVAQIDSTLTDGNKSIDQLTESFTVMAEQVEDIFQQLEKSKIKEELNIRQSAEVLRSHISTAVVAFQFYDRLTQRMEHVVDSLERVGSIIADPEQRYRIDAWMELQAYIRSRYTMESERKMFEHIMAGYSVAEALKIYHEQHEAEENNTDDEDDVELF